MVRKTNLQFIILFSFVIFGLVASPALLSSAYDKGYRTSGDISFIDGSGKLLNGKMEITGDGRSSGTEPNVNSISWDKVPDAKIRFNALDTKDVSVDFVISGDSPKGKVMIENYGSNVPGGVNSSAPGVPVKYVEISASSVFFSEAGISIRYSDKELKGNYENSLAIYSFDSASKTWNKLPASIDAGNNILSTTVNSLSIFALSAPAQEKKAVRETSNKIVVHDAKNIPVTGDIRTYDRNRALKKETKTSTLSSTDIPESGELEVDALKSKNVSLKLKLRSQTGGEIILDDHGKKNPVAQAPPGTAVKYVDISTRSLDFDSAEVRIHYSDAELGDAKENELFIYHWNGASWEPLRTTVDPANNMLTATTTSLSPFAVSGGTGGTGRILVAANRFVILEDPRTTGARNGAGFTLPVYDYSTWNFWANKTTTINATALYIDENGAPVNDTVIRFILYDPDGTVNSTSDVATNSFGLANFSFDMDQTNFYGRWSIRAENGSIGQNTTFVYNWWGCSYNTDPCSQNHGSTRTPTASGGASANSPYATGRDTTVNQNTAHSGGTTNCTFCHQSYDGNSGGAWANWGNHTSFSSADTHRNIRCDNASCHSGLSVHKTNEVIASCYNTTGGCHTSRADISNKSTLSSSTVPTALSLYSINTSAFNSTFHTPNSTIPCVICHGPMHNISKPDTTLKLTNNSYTEDSNCRNCHSSYVEHNSSNATSGGVNCTLCHSDDVHAIQVFSRNGTYVTLNKSGPNADRGDCTSCHQNSTLFETIKSNQKAGQQTGRNPPIIPNPLHHADVLTNGTRYGGYWTYDSADLSCKYCHGYVNHKSTALGRPSLFMGSNRINATFAGGTTSWCLLCHYPDSANYSDMVTTFEGDNLSVPPSIIKGSQYYVSGRNHSYAVYNDSLCYTCHNGTASATGISQFIHETQVGGGGPDCLSCHDMEKNGSVLHVNNTVMKLSMHANVNNNSANSSGVSADNKKCWGCHQSDGSEPENTSMGNKYDKPYTCYECHLKGTKPYDNVANAGSVVNHIDEDSPLTRIVTHNATCTTCHNNSVNLNITYITDQRTISEDESVALYGTNTSLVETIGDVKPEGCTYCHLNAINAAMWGQPHDPTRLTSPRVHVETNNSQCYPCHIQGTTPPDFHNDSMYYAGDGKILVATNKYVVLDDPVKTPAKVGTGFSLPRNNWSTTYWTGKNTKINATALFVDRYGTPVSGTKINFTIYMPNGTALTTVNDTTNAYGLANFSYDMNAKNYYGNWIIRATNGSIGANTTFIYNWWGCSGSTTGSCSGHNSENPGTAGNGNSPYLSGRDSVTGRKTAHTGGNCTWCHLSFDGKPGGSTGNYLNKPSDVHRNITCDNANCHGTYTTHNSNQLIYSCYNSACHTPANRSDLSNKSTLSSSTVSSATSLYSYYNGSSFNATFHTPNSTVPCIICHGPMHAITKTDTSQRFIRNNATEYGHCIACHQEYVLHNNSVGCSVCHSEDVHVIQVFAQNGTFITLNKRNQNPATGNCTNCHQNSSFFNALLAIPKTGNYTGTGSTQVVSPMKHSQDPVAGTKWNQTPGYWNNSNQITWCSYCHNNDSHTGTMLGRVSLSKGNNTVNSTIGNTTWCSSCHWQGYANGTNTYLTMTGYFTMDALVIPPEISGHATYGANQSISGYTNHANFSKDDNSCFTCHNGNLGAGARMTAFMHNVSIGEAGGPDCITCHNLVTGLSGNAPSGINFTSANSSVHYGMNSNNATGQGYAAIIGACWACHGSNGTAPSRHPDRYKTPKTCTECHLGSGTYNTSSYNATIVDEHYYSGFDIKIRNSTSNISSCINCHENASEMTLYNNDTDIGSFTGDEIRLNGGNKSFYHYGKKRDDLAVIQNTTGYCMYCHQNSSTSFPVTNKSISNHTSTPLSPGCNEANCHIGGRIHNSTLNKTLNCINCHTSVVSQLELGYNNDSAPTGQNMTHKRDTKVSNDGKDPPVGANIMYSRHANPNSSGGYSGASGSARDPNQICLNCHSSIIRANGDWREQNWESTNSCKVCHTIWLGSIIYSGVQLNLIPNAHNLSMPRCTDCHAMLSPVSYAHNVNSLVPPDAYKNAPKIGSDLNSSVHYRMTLNITSGHPTEEKGCLVCHTNATYSINYSANPINITITDYNGSHEWNSDPYCTVCHPLAGGGQGPTPTNHASFSITEGNNSRCYDCHSISSRYGHSVESSGGSNCIGCHDYGDTASNHRINSTDMESGIHANLNSNATNSSWVPAENKKCWGCHDASGSQPANDSMGSRYTNPYKCYDCHNSTGKPYSNVSSAMNVSGHFKGGGMIKSATNALNDSSSCLVCHNLSEMKVNYSEDDAYGSNYSFVSHYGKNRTLDTQVRQGTSTNCSYCHQNVSTAFVSAMTNSGYNSSIQNHSLNFNSPSCNNSTCHNSGWIHNSTLSRPNFTLPNTTFCQDCHADRQKHNNTQECSSCHINSSSNDTIHPIKYIQSDGSFGTENTSAVNCTNCHQSTLSGFTTAPIIPATLKHSSNLTNGSIWGMFWTSGSSSCYYCHNNTKHNSTALGNISSLLSDTNNTRNGSLSTTTWCADCHYNASMNTNYKGSQWSPSPPLITIDNTGKSYWINHSTYLGSGYKDNNCILCHALNGSYFSTSLNYSHSLDEGRAGGANCTACHDVGGSAGSGRLVNFSAMNETGAIHKNLNIGISSPSGYPSTNFKCWACHGNGSEPGTSHPSNYKTPYLCEDCHVPAVGQNLNFTPASILNVTQHYKNGTNISTANTSSCYSCHNLSEMMIGTALDPDGPASVYGGINGGNNNSGHYGKKRADYPSSGTNNYCYTCHNNVSTVFPFIEASNKTISNHSTVYPSTNPACSDCHGTGRIHNSTLYKPSLMLPNSSYCASCHSSKQQHNGTINCTQCHLNTSRSIHPARYLQADTTWNTARTNAVNCTTCHQSSFSGFSNAPLVPTTLKHSSNLTNGSIWGTFWTSGSSSCYYCHNNTKHNSTALGNVTALLSDTNNSRNGSLSTTTWCADCHYNSSLNTNYNGNQWVTSPPLITVDNTGKSYWINHSTYLSSGYKDSNCVPCHSLNGSYFSTSLNYSHSLNEGVAGGANCTACHDVGGSAGAGRLVNFSAMNDTGGIHKNLNIGTTSSSGYPITNFKCWACHGNGSEPGSGHPSNYKTPYLCENCHVPDAGQNMNFTPSSILNVTRHHKNGTNISTANASSCYSCHNMSEMMVGTALDPDGPASVYGGINGGNNNSGHYGKKRTDYPAQGTNNYCYTCHNNTSTVFPFIDTDNKTIANHSQTYPNTNPPCSDCHGAGRIHNSTLYKPSLTLPNSTYCTECHGTGGTATIRNLSQHNGTVNCTQCHLNTSSSIHPVRYLQTDSTWNIERTNAINCTNCHQSALAGFMNAPLIPATLKHSANLTNGTIWGMFWMSGNSSCYYCHNNTKHNGTALGRINNLLSDTNNSRNGSLTTTTWCSDCHYNASVNTNYKGNQWVPSPPLITVDNTGKSYWINHSTYLGSGYKDTNCLPCHALNSSYLSTSLNYSHSLNQGVAGGANCTACHDIGGSAGAGRLVNFSAMNESNAIHQNLNIGATTSLPAENKKCWACHGNGSEPGTSHPSNYRTPYLCENCHVPDAGQNMNFTPISILNVTQHYRNGTNISTANASSCYSCHNRSEMMLGNYDPDGPASVYGGINGGNNNSGHYGKKRTDYPSSGTNNYCYTCHNNASTVFPFIDSNNRTISNHSITYPSTNPPCSDCHGSGRIHNSTLYKQSLTLPNSTYCTACHGTGGTATVKNLSSHNNSVNCTRCHLNASSSIHPVRYLQADSTWNTTGTSAVNCTNCHQSTLSGFTTAPIIPATLKHSANITNGSIWGMFWTSGNGSCYYCHSNTKHNSTALGNVSSLLSDTNNSRNGSLSTTMWCSDCHYNASVNTNYKGNQWIPSPPLITVDNTGKSYWINHSTYLGSGYKDSNCIPCHSLNGSYSSTSLNYSHSLNQGVAGGANCTACHDVGGSAGAGRLVNFSAMNESNAIHQNLNIGAATSLPVENKKCWACHGNGSEPGTSHPSNYKTPYLCENCHVPDAGQNMNFTPASILNVTQHYKNGTNISTANASSCYSCHNMSEMMIGSYDPDGPASIYGGINGGNNNPGHYGKKRIDYPSSGTNNYCYTCHNNASTVFPFIDENNKTISNHSTAYPSTNPACSDCHGTGRIHNSTLYRPSFSLPNSTYCTSCHSSKQQHNGTVDCTRCHLNTSNSIHPARYLESGGSTWSTSKINAANCSNCHQSLLPGFTNTPVIPVLKHSVDTSSGQKWGNYWNNTSVVTACYYCHQNETHKANNLLGNISSIKGSNTYNNPTLSNSTWCINCHYTNASQYNGSILSPIPPEITNSSLNASDGTVFYNHSGLSGFNDSICKDCHGGVLPGYLETTLNFSHSVSEGGGGPDCISCHDMGESGAPDNKRVNTSYVKMGVHKNLNSNATNTTAIDPVNKACWACHGEGTEPSGHPARYRTPRECSNNDCHSLSQSFKAPMVYSHFKDAGLNSNPGNITNLNVSVKASCESCHSNSIAANSIATSSDNLNASVSHYANRDKLIDSINCIYCHLDRDNAEKWGNATEINKNRTAMIEMDRIRNKFTARVGEFVELGLGYRLKIKGISDQRGTAILELYSGNDLLDTGLVNTGRYIYEENRIIDNSSTKIPIIVLNITGMFLKDNNEGFIQFEGSRIKRLHPENRTTSCYLCHFTGGTEKHKYTVMDMEDDYLYYTEVLINSSGRKEYDQEKALQILATATSSDAHIDIDRANRKTIKKGEKWKLAENYALNLEDVAQNSDSAIFLLDVGGTRQTNVVRKGETLDYQLKINYLGYTYSNITIFRAKVSEIMQPGIVILEDIVALSPEITRININSSVYGYNASWFIENNTFMTGKIPENIHSPLFFDGRDGGADCTSCHNMGDLGFHKAINQEARSTVSTASKACWACHGEGNEPGMHPINYKQPKDCKSCHVDRKIPFYNATYIGDEKHSAIEDCRPCHVVGTHKIIRFYVTPGIKELSISENEVYAGEKIILNATAASGYAMSIRGAEYYIDSPSNVFPMSARDGSFDGRVEEMTAEIDTAGLEPGEHLVFVRAMERNDKWGPESSITLVIKETSDKGSGKMIPEVPGFILILILIALAIRERRSLR